MKIETVALEDQQTKLIAEFDSDTLDKYMHQAARKISQNQKIPGFRPGKAPYDLVRRMYGDEALQEQAIEIMLDEVYPQVIKEANINPSGPGKLEKIVSTNPPTFEFVVPLPPEVTLGDYKEIRKDYEAPEVTDEQVNATILRLQRSYATAEPVERPAQKGDMVSFMLNIKRVNPAEGEPENLVENTPYQIIAGEQDEDQEETWPYEGFTDELVGLKADETKQVTHTFDEESPYEDLRGKEAEFNITVQSVKELHLPELNDEFAQSLGQFENVEELRKMVRTQIEQNNQQQYDQDYFDDLIGQVVEQSTIKYPPHMLDDEIEQFIHGLEHNLEHDHLDLETYLKMREMDRQTFVDQEVKPAAQRRLERSLVLEEFAHQEGVEVRNEEIQSIYYTAMQQLQQTQQQVKGKKRQETAEMANTLAVNTVNNIFNQRLMSRLKAIATGKGDEAAVESILDTEMPETASLPEAGEAEAGETPLESNIEAEAAPEPESTQMNSITSEAEAEEEQDVAENDLLTEEPPQANKETGEDQA